MGVYMGVYIRGMKMPKSCDDCKLHNGMGKDDGKVIYHCALLAKWVVPNPLAETNDCPLIELPPHGDLIDRRKLPLAFIDITDLPTDRCLPVYLQEDVDDTPTIIEAEEGE